MRGIKHRELYCYRKNNHLSGAKVFFCCCSCTNGTRPSVPHVERWHKSNTRYTQNILHSAGKSSRGWSITNVRQGKVGSAKHHYNCYIPSFWSYTFVGSSAVIFFHTFVRASGCLLSNVVTSTCWYETQPFHRSPFKPLRRAPHSCWNETGDRTQGDLWSPYLHLFISRKINWIVSSFKVL